MENFTPISASVGGALIGLSAVFLMWSVGRIAGISGILGGLFTATKNDRLWRVSFLIGLILGPTLVSFWNEELLDVTFPVQGSFLILAGVLVGLGTQLGSGCTSGHGVCGNARLSMRSLIATATFMITGIVTVFILKHFVGG
ncbi:hypothetical protein DES40_0844 [Litorimonas taeanensis]|uniref:Uncharacterized protein n=1 Tax=Litorimonas taeanensis TaxID=568099 RepID=A0A420WKE3_9PROT|nr:YeeE/YedE family protein [Litorimonas taeanensis]RKQ71521.1 hypothetical protein DES40_0844 [Litorimonas taeanensis]